MKVFRPTIFSLCNIKYSFYGFASTCTHFVSATVCVCPRRSGASLQLLPSAVEWRVQSEAGRVEDPLVNDIPERVRGHEEVLGVAIRFRPAVCLSAESISKCI